MSGRWAFLERPVDPASIAAFRAMFGLLMLISTIRFAANGWIASLYIEPELHFHYWGFAWVEPLPSGAMYAVFVGLGALSVLIMLGLYTRAALALFFALFTYVDLIDKATYLNHYYFVSAITALMLVLPMARGGSLDTLWRGRERGMRSPAWALYALRCQVGAVYVFAGLAKLRVDWLVQGQPLKIWLGARSDLPLIGSLLGLPETAMLMSWGGALFDLCAPFLLLHRRTRPYAYICVLVFHGLTATLFPAIGMFPWIMAASALIFFPPAWPRRWLGPVGEGSAGPSVAEGARLRASRPVRIVLVLFAVIQLALPLRRFAYPGDTAWTEEGFRFAWQVMLVEKVGAVRYRVRERGATRDRLVSPEDHLSALQAKQMAFQPDMILEYAHLIAAQERALGRRVEVRADAYVTYNGRPHARLIDPDVDLVRQVDGLAPKAWILPLPR